MMRLLLNFLAFQKKNCLKESFFFEMDAVGRPGKSELSMLAPDWLSVGTRTVLMDDFDRRLC